MATWTLSFDGLERFGLLRSRRRADPAGGPGACAVPPAERLPAAAGSELNARRAAAMRGLFPKLSAWMARRSYLAEMREVDRYLSKATNVFELEERIRRLERRGSTSNGF